MKLAIRLALLVVVVGIVLQFLLQKTFDPKDMKGKRVIVTGASMGIGEHMAYELSKMGAHVVIVARSVDKMKRIADKCTQLGAASINYLSVDLSTKNEADYQNLIETSVQILGGKLDMLVLNHLAPGTEIVFKDWPTAFKQRGLSWLNDIYYVNSFSYMILSNYALPYLEASNGNLIVVSSMTGVVGMGITVGYSSMKHSLHGYFNALRNNLAMNSRYNMSITLGVLGAIGTDEMIKNAGKVKVTPAPVDDCARSIIKSGFMRERDMWYPYDLVRPGTIIAPLFPSFFDRLSNYMANVD